MKRRQLLAIFTALAVSLCSAALMVGCAGKTVYYTDFAYDANSKPIPAGEQVSLVSTTDDQSSSAASSSGEETPAEDSSEAPAEESSEAPAEESSEAPAEESSEAPAEESSEAPADESSEAPAAEGVVIKFEKPTDGAWASKTEVYAYVYSEGDKDKKNADYPGQLMTDNGDGTYSYTVPADIPNPTVIFNCQTEKTKYPRSGSLAVENGKTYTVE